MMMMTMMMKRNRDCPSRFVRTPQAGSPRPGGGPTGGREGNFVERILIKIADERFSARSLETPQAGSPRPGGGPTGGREGNFVERILIKIADERFSARGLERRAAV